eukprot:84057-Ditylum_brightwellii.AAC.1
MMTVLKNIDTLITVLGTNIQKSFHRWMLSMKTVDDSTYLFNNIKKDSNKVFYFISKEILHSEVDDWLNDLFKLLHQIFSYKDIDLITTDKGPNRTYRVIPMEYTEDAAFVYDTVLSGQLIIDDE